MLVWPQLLLSSILLIRVVRASQGFLTPLRIRATLIGLGTALVGLTAVEMYYWWIVRSFIEISFVAGILMSLPAAVLLIAGGYWLPHTVVSEDSYRRLLLWTVAGMVVFGGFSVITGVTFFPEMIWAQIGSARWGVSVGSGSGFLIGFLVARGIERRVAAERAAIRAEEASEKQEILEYLNALLRHEVLNTAQVIGGQATLLESELDEATPSQQYTDTIKRQAKELSSVTEDVRFLLKASKEDPDLEPVCLRSVLEAELQNINDRYEGVETELDAPSEIQVIADDLVRRVFSNLLTNAVKHNDSKRKRVSIAVTQGTETVTAQIKDNGPGIPEDDIDELFEPVISQTANHGLGLTIVARLVDRYDGEIELAETGPDGSTFTVTLPSPQNGARLERSQTGDINESSGNDSGDQ